MEPQPISIACACDNKYAVLATTMLKSIELNHVPTAGPIDAYFLDNGISRRRLEMIESSLDTDKIRLHFMRPEKKHLALLQGIPNARKLTAYFRLLLPDMLPKNVKKLLYLDCDILVLHPISALWETHLADSEIVAAVQDHNAGTVGCDWGGGISNYAAFGMKKNDEYFNSGVLLMDIEKWRSQEISRQVVEINVKHYSQVKWLDQFGLNVVLHGKWKALDSTWNTYPECEHPQPHILHFTSCNPNAPDYGGRCQEHFFRVLDQTAWRGKRPKQFKAPHWVPRALSYQLNRFIQPW